MQLALLAPKKQKYETEKEEERLPLFVDDIIIYLKTQGHNCKLMRTRKRVLV